MAQPIDDRAQVRRLEHVAERVGRRKHAPAGDRREQVQIVVAEDACDAAAEPHDAPEHGQRIRAAIDEIADEPETITRRAKRDLAQQCVEGRSAALNVADREQPHIADGSGLGNGVPHVVDECDETRPLFRERTAHAARDLELAAAQLRERRGQGARGAVLLLQQVGVTAQTSGGGVRVLMCPEELLKSFAGLRRQLERGIGFGEKFELVAQSFGFDAQLVKLGGPRRGQSRRLPSRRTRAALCRMLVRTPSRTVNERQRRNAPALGPAAMNLAMSSNSAVVRGFANDAVAR